MVALKVDDWDANLVAAKVHEKVSGKVELMAAQRAGLKAFLMVTWSVGKSESCLAVSMVEEMANVMVESRVT